MTPIEIHNEQLAGRIIKHLERRNFNAHYCATAAEAISLVQSLMPEGSSVSWGGSQTIREMGLTHHLTSSGKYKVIDRDKAETPEQTRQCYLGAMDVDYFLTSANAITQDGVIVNIDGRGNRVAAITWGPHNVIHLIGMNKVASALEAALARARNTAAPINTARLGCDTPCRLDGVC
ncbi:MAG: lactate utilization protein, partial [Muribaculaceae bacterium]|nr:lactate utilization protein [Muribaculaceae bacterium]